MLSQRWRLVITATLLTPPLVWWGWNSPTAPDTNLGNKPDIQVDFFIQNADMTRWSQDGTPAHSINTQLMRHLPERGLTLLSAPEVLVPAEPGQPPYRLRADQGQVPDSQEQVELAGNVLLHDNPLSGAAVELSTEQLTFFPAEDRAHTGHSVQIQHGDDITEALGMDVFFEEQRIELLSDVKGVYHVP
ncbi:MAG: LPS export ABC transporter periplasmic protein LptC [Marinobacterium sp.]